MVPTKRLPEPWHSFLQEIDAAASGSLRLDCIGGFVVTQLYGLDRPTTDIDVIVLAPAEIASVISALASRGGPLAQKHRIYIDKVAVAAIPEAL